MVIQVLKFIILPTFLLDQINIKWVFFKFLYSKIILKDCIINKQKKDFN